MNSQSLIEQLQQELTQQLCDIKIESQLLQALEHGLLPEDFLVLADGLFKRPYSRDLLEAELKTDPRRQASLELHLSRGGLFDQLPEGLFFQQSSLNMRSAKAADMAADYKYNRKQEEEIRRFFLPVEHDFFLQRLQVEKEEVQLLEGLQSDILNEYFTRFWNLPMDIPKAFVVPFILLLPYAYKIAGNLKLMTDALHLLLDEPVSVTQKENAFLGTGEISMPALGDGQLGIDLVCCDTFWDGTPYLEAMVGPLQHSVVSDYLQGGMRYQLLQTFNRFFVPAGIDMVFSVDVAREKAEMQLNEFDGPVLGYSSILG